MSTKTSTVQPPPGRRTPLSLNASTKPNKPTIEKNQSNKTENSKKDSQPERKSSSDKKQQSLTETRKPSSSSSSSSSAVDSKKLEDIKPTKEENKKNQNGVSSNGVKDKDKQSTNGGTVKPKTDTTSGSSTPKKESHKSDRTELLTKAEDHTNKTDEKNKEKTNHDNTKDESKKEKEATIEEIIVEKKNTDEKPALAKIPEKAKPVEKSEDVINLDSSPEGSINLTPIKGKDNEGIITKIEETPKKEEKPVRSPIDQLEDVEMMEPLTFEVEPSLQISAASTPAKTYNYKETYNRSAEKLPKISPKSETKPPREPVTHTPEIKSCPRTFSSISGRRSIRSMGDYNFSGNLNIRESYRKINTELDFTISSMNVTVGSEVPNNDSFSFCSRPRKRDRSSTSRQSAMDVQGDISPKSPKRAKIDLGVTGFFSAMASPISMLRARLSRATVQSTPKKQIDIPIEEDIVQNVSGVSVEEELTATEDLTVNPDSFVDNVAIENAPKLEESVDCLQKPTAEADVSEQNIKIKETITTTDTQAKKKCSIM